MGLSFSALKLCGQFGFELFLKHLSIKAYRRQRQGAGSSCRTRIAAMRWMFECIRLRAPLPDAEGLFCMLWLKPAADVPLGVDQRASIA